MAYNDDNAAQEINKPITIDSFDFIAFDVKSLKSLEELKYKNPKVLTMLKRNNLQVFESSVVVMGGRKIIIKNDNNIPLETILLSINQI
jgi:hypothetical protein